MTENGDKQRQPAANDRGVAEELGARVSHDAGIYVAGAFVGFALALVNVAVITRYLSPSEFGELALLLVFAAFLTIFYNLGTLQGTFMWVFGSAGEEDVDDDAEQSATGTKRRALGTGLITTIVISGIGTAVVALMAPWLADLMLGDSADGDLVLIAAAAGAVGAIWRLVTNIPRMERHPRSYVALNTVRPVFVVGAVVPLMATGGGVEGAIAGTAIGSALSVVVGLIVSRRSFELALDRNDVRNILSRGAIFVPIILSFWIAQNVDLYALSAFAPDDTVGLYRLANRAGAFAHYFTSAFLMAWQPLRRTSTFTATVQEKGKDVLGGTMLLYFVLGGMVLLVGMTVASDVLVRIAPPAYADAAPLIPVVATGFVAHGLLVAVYRVSSFRYKRTAYVASAAAAAVVFLGSAPLLIPWLDAFGAALSVILGFLAAAAGITFLSQRGGDPLRIDWRRIAAGIALAGICVGIAKLGGELGGWLQAVLGMIAFVLYPALLIVTEVIPREDLRAVARVVRDMLPRRRRAADLEANVRALRPAAASALEGVVIQGWSVTELADRLGAEPAETEIRLVRLLRQMSGSGSRTDHDQRIGRYLFSEMAVAERDAMAQRLWSDDADAADLHRLELTLDGLRRVPKEVWREARQGNGS